MKIHFNPIIDSTIAFFPRMYANQAVMFYILSLSACTLLFFSHAMPLYIILMGVVSILLFFLGSSSLGRQWSRLREGAFVKKVFWTAFWIRLIYAVFIWYMNKYQYGTFYESSEGDIMWYVPTALESIQEEGGFFEVLPKWAKYSISIADSGYQWWLAFLFWIQGGASAVVSSGNYGTIAESYLWLPMLFKAVFGAFTCVLMYRIAQRHFGENVARMTAIFCMLQWNMIWWCGSFMKETEMVFLATLFVNRMDKTIMGLDLKPWSIALTVAIGLAIFSFRSALFMVAFAATILALVLQNSHKLSTGKKVLAGVMIAVAMAFAVGDTIINEVHEITERAQSDHQQTNMEWRAEREHGNQFAKYAGAAVFAPLIFTIPFPNMVYTYQSQEMLMQVNGGNFEKNVLSFFVIFALFQLLFSGQWRQHVFPIAYLIGYLAALALSEFAQSGRFHMPAMPFLMLFAAYGLTMVTSRKHKQWFTYALIAEVGFCVFWSWFKLKGQGLI